MEEMTYWQPSMDYGAITPWILHTNKNYQLNYMYM